MNDAARLRLMTTRDLAVWGLQDVAYVKPVIAEDGSRAYAIHAADGSEIGIAQDYETAFAAIRQHDMEPVSAH